MTKFVILLIAAVLAPGLHVFVESRDLPVAGADPIIYDDEEYAIPEIRPLPIGSEFRPLPLPISPDLRPLPLPVVPELRPLPVEEEETVVVPELRPLPVPQDPCAACFSYMSTLIEQLTDVVEQPPIGAEVLPHPLPVEPEIQPHPLPVAPVVRPQPLPVVPVIRPLPLPIVPEAVPEIRPAVTPF